MSVLNRPAPIPVPSVMGAESQPTVTDANLLLGRLQPDKFLGGTFRLDLERTRAVTSEWLKQQGFRLSLEQFAEGVIRVVNANMERALRVVSIERGYDPREFTLVAFGGAGGLHACELAQALGIPRVIIPAMPGALSAYGILASDIVQDYSRTVVLSIELQATGGESPQTIASAGTSSHSKSFEPRDGPARFTLSVVPTCAIAVKASN